VLDLSYNLTEARERILSTAEKLHEYRHDSASTSFVSYISSVLNVEILNLALGKELNEEAYSYHRGRVDAVKELIDRREVFISHQENAKSKDRATDHKAKSNYLPQRPKSTAGLSI